jgi:acyl-coenzyme A synthetase/AMP-(fatty) acid ligase
MATSLQPYPMSPRNSPEGVCHMLESVSCTRILGQASTASLIHQVQNDMQVKGIKLRIDELPGLPEVFPKLGRNANEMAGEVKPYPTSSKRVDVRTPSLYMHSSGSTGYPKSIHFTHRRMLQWMAASKFIRHLYIRHVMIDATVQTRLAGAVMCASVRWDFQPSIP